jgi:hypothetical protein
MGVKVVVVVVMGRQKRECVVISGRYLQALKRR